MEDQIKATGKAITRRHMLKAAGVTLALPMLDYFQPRAFGSNAPPPIRRMLCFCTPLGLHPEFFFPSKAGRDYDTTPYLDVLKDFRDDFSVISGLSHPEVGASHDSIYSFLTASAHPEIRGGFRNAISLDQIADHVEHSRHRLRPGRLHAFGAGSRDRDKLDEYFTSVRELEGRIATSEQWSKNPSRK